MLYQDFDLSIEPSDAAATHYRVRVLDSDAAGQVSGEFVLPFSALELDNFLLRVGRPRRSVRGRRNSPELAAAIEFGSKLYRALFQDQVQIALARSLDAAQSTGKGLRIRLRLTQAPRLIDLPWEFLYDPTRQRFFSQSNQTPLVRFVDLPHPIPPLLVQTPLKMLVMIASPHGYDQLDVEKEWRDVQTALGDLEGRGLVQVTRLSHGTLAALRRQLQREQYHIIHFIGHGAFDTQTAEGVLLLADEQGQPRLVGGQILGTLLHDHRSLRLVVLNSCEGARATPSDPFAGVAQTLVQQGIPAVIAMQFEITDAAALTLAQEFYTVLADGSPVDTALAEARKAIYTDGNDIEWGTPVLYLRARDGQLFDLAAQSTARPAVIERTLVQPLTPEPASPHDSAKTETQSNLLKAPFITEKTRDERAAIQRPKSTGPIFQDEERKLKDAKHIFRDEAHESKLILQNTDKQSSSILQPQHSSLSWDRIWDRIIIGLLIALVFLFISMAGYTWQDGRRQAQATATAQAQATATKEAIFAAATAMAPQAQITATVLAVQAKATMQSAAPALLPLVERYGMHFVYVPAGEFMMGSPDGTGETDEHPQSKVTVAAFWIGQTEVTNAQYRPFVDGGGYQQDQWWTKAGLAWRDTNKVTKPSCWDDTPGNQENYPVICVSWYEAYAYTQWLADATKLAIHLPNEAEWEWAARGDDGRIYPWGNDPPTDKLLNYNSNLGHTVAVGSYPEGKSPYGALDLAGNVWEWTNSRYLDYPYTSNGDRENAEGDAGRVLRGGSWSSDVDFVRAASRYGFTPDFRDLNVGVRVVVLAPQ